MWKIIKLVVGTVIAFVIMLQMLPDVLRHFTGMLAR
jgi:hypothetical protein